MLRVMLLPQWADYPGQTGIYGCPAYGGCDRWVGRSGAGHGTKVQTRRGLIQQVTEGSSQEWEFRCPCGNLGSGAESGPWHRAVPRRQGRGLGYRPGQPGRWKGSSAARVACRAGPGLKSRARL